MESWKQERRKFYKGSKVATIQQKVRMEEQRVFMRSPKWETMGHLGMGILVELLSENWVN